MHDTPGWLGQSDAPFDWYSGGHRFDPRPGHIYSVEIWSRNNFYGYSLPTADSSRVVVSYLRMYGHLVLVNRLESLPLNSVDSRVNWPAGHDLNSVAWAAELENKQDSD